MITAAVGAAVVLFILLLGVHCVFAGQDVQEAHEELDEKILQLQKIASSIERTGGRSARLAGSRVVPFRRILARAEDDTEPQTGRP